MVRWVSSRSSAIKKFWAIKINKIHDTNFIFATTKGSMNICMELVGFSTSNKVKNHSSIERPGLKWHRDRRSSISWPGLHPTPQVTSIEIAEPSSISNNCHGVWWCNSGPFCVSIEKKGRVRFGAGHFGAGRFGAITFFLDSLFYSYVVSVCSSLRSR